MKKISVPDFMRRPLISAAALSIVVILAAAIYAAFRWHADRFYVPYDGDVWMRYLRIRDLIRTGEWYNSLFPQINYPHGDIVPWTRLFDLLILLPAAFLKYTGLYEWREAILWSGSWISPFLYLVSCIGIARIGRSLHFKEGQIALLLLAFALHPLMHSIYQFGRGDHHSLLACLFVFSVTGFIRLLQKPDDRQVIFQLAILLLLGLWAATEFMALIFLCLLHLGLLWLQGDRQGLSVLRRLSVMLTFFCIPLLLIEKGADDFILVEHDRISIVHLALLTAASIVTCATYLAERHLSSPSRRILFVIALSAPLFLICNHLFPRFYLGPYAAYDERILSFAKSQWNELWNITKLPLGITLSLVILLFASLGGLYEAFKKRILSRPILLFIALLSFAYIGLTASAYRWHYYAVPVLLPGLVWFIDHMLRPLLRYQRLVARVNAIGWFVALAIFIFIIPYTNNLPWGARNNEGRSQICRLGLDYMLQHDVLDFADKMIMAQTHHAAWLIYWTDARTIGSSYTRNVEGILDTKAFFEASTSKKAAAVLKKRDVDKVIFCPGDNVLLSQESSPYLVEDRYTPPVFPSFIAMTPGSLPRIFHVDKLKLSAFHS